jgi:hypothetical protein
MSSNLLSKPSGSRINIASTNSGLNVTIPSMINTGKGIATLLVIALWIITVMVWTVLMLSIKPNATFLAIPFWLIGIMSFLKSRKILSIAQSLTITSDFIEFTVMQGAKKESTRFALDDIKVLMVEGSYYSVSGLNRRGIYPAIIYNDEAFGFAERSNTFEKKWLVQTISDFINK